MQHLLGLLLTGEGAAAAVTVTSVKTLDAVSQSVALAARDSLGFNQTLPGHTSTVALKAELLATVAQTLPVHTSETTAANLIGLAASQILPAHTQEAGLEAEPEPPSEAGILLLQSLEQLASSATAEALDGISIDQALEQPAQTVTASAPLTINLTANLLAVTQTIQLVPEGTQKNIQVAQVLLPVSQALTGEVFWWKTVPPLVRTDPSLYYSLWNKRPDRPVGGWTKKRR